MFRHRRQPPLAKCGCGIKVVEGAVLFKTIARLWRMKSGVSAFEYGLVAALIAVAAATAITSLSTTLIGGFQEFGAALESVK